MSGKYPFIYLLDLTSDLNAVIEEGTPLCVQCVNCKGKRCHSGKPVKGYCTIKLPDETLDKSLQLQYQLMKYSKLYSEAMKCAKKILLVDNDSLLRFVEKTIDM